MSWKNGHLVTSTGNETEWPALWFWLWSQSPGRSIWRETVVLCAYVTLSPPSPKDSIPTSKKDLREKGLAAASSQSHMVPQWLWREQLLESDIYKWRLLICPTSSTCSHINQKDRWWKITFPGLSFLPVKWGGIRLFLKLTLIFYQFKPHFLF